MNFVRRIEKSHRMENPIEEWKNCLHVRNEFFYFHEIAYH